MKKSRDESNPGSAGPDSLRNGAYANSMAAMTICGMA